MGLLDLFGVDYNKIGPQDTPEAGLLTPDDRRRALRQGLISGFGAMVQAGEGDGSDLRGLGAFATAFQPAYDAGFAQAKEQRVAQRDLDAYKAIADADPEMPEALKTAIKNGDMASVRAMWPTYFANVNKTPKVEDNWVDVERIGDKILQRNTKNNQLRWAGGGGINIDMGSKFEGKFIENRATELAGMESVLNDRRPIVSELKNFREDILSGDFKTDVLAPIRKGFNSIMVATGFASEEQIAELGQAEAFRAATQRALNTFRPQKIGQITEKEWPRLERTLPLLERSPEGNIAILDAMIAAQEYNQAVHTAEVEWLHTKGTIPRGTDWEFIKNEIEKETGLADALLRIRQIRDSGGAAASSESTSGGAKEIPVDLGD